MRGSCLALSWGFSTISCESIVSKNWEGRPRDIYHMNIGKRRDRGEGEGGGELLTKVMSLRWRSTGFSHVKAIWDPNQLSNCPHFDRRPISIYCMNQQVGRQKGRATSDEQVWNLTSSIWSPEHSPSARRFFTGEGCVWGMYPENKATYHSFRVLYFFKNGRLE